LGRARATAIVISLVVALIAPAGQARATFPGSNGELAYVRVGTGGWSSTSIRTLNPDGSPGPVLWPAGKLLGTRFHQAAPWNVEWSPDGLTVAFGAIGTTLGYDRLLVGDPATGERTVIFRMQPFDQDGFIPRIAFSPTGDRLLFCVVTLSTKTTSRLYTIGIDGSGLTKVSGRNACIGDWSSTNRIVAVVGGRLEKLVTMAPDGSDLQVVLPADGRSREDADPHFSPDGNTIVYLAKAGGHGLHDLFAVPVTGGDPVRLTRTPRLDESSPVFSPDGTTIAFARSRGPNDPTEIYTLSVDGSHLTRVTATAKRWEYPRSWQAVP
jgi:Tol biopolymer transport system component